ncbi:unnamed protein product [Camellia sinensis]
MKYDGAVGDITITANRSFYVDFTLPFAEEGVTMVVPITYEGTNSKWTFLKPLSSDLWLTCTAFFLFTGFVVWFMEHRVNTDFRGEKIVSNLARLVMTVWLFVVLVLSSSYTASLSSRLILTVQKLRPTVTDVNELIKNGDYVGYRSGSFIADILKDMGFDKSKITPCKSRVECNDALSKGRKNGGKSALFGVAPYNKLFVSRYCGKYTTIGPIYRADGFGFHCSDTPSLSRNCNSNGLVIPLEVEMESASEVVDSNVEDVVV